MCFGYAVTCSLTTEPPTLHNPLKSLSHSCALHIHILPRHKMPHVDCCTLVEQRVWCHAELSEISFGGHASGIVHADHGLCEVLEFPLACPHLQSSMPVFLQSLALHHLIVLQHHHSDSKAGAPLVPQGCHAALQANHPSATSAGIGPGAGPFTIICHMPHLPAHRYA